MLFDNLPTPMPWYERIELQDRFRQNVACDPRILQLAPYDGLLPFQFNKPVTSELPVSWVVRCASDAPLEEYINGFEDEIIVDLTAFILPALEWTTLNGKDVFYFTDDKNAVGLFGALPDGLPPGHYYMEMEFTQSIGGSGLRFVSELFRVPQDRFSWDDPATCNYICFKWYHSSDIAPIHYLLDESFYNLLYLDTFITASEPAFDVEAETDGFKEEIAIFQKAIIKYEIACIIPDFAKVALYVMQMHDNKYITLEKGFRSGEIKNPEVSHTLTNDGAYSEVKVMFEQIELLTQTGCANNMETPEPFEYGPHPTLVTAFCNSSGGVSVHITGFMPTGLYGELQGQVGAGPWVSAIPYISRPDLLAGYTGSVGPGTGFINFKVIFHTFTFTVGESAESTPTPTC